ncbi:hypothetical protein D3C75_1344750 [compost metagenome]
MARAMALSGFVISVESRSATMITRISRTKLAKSSLSLSFVMVAYSSASGTSPMINQFWAGSLR